MKYINLYCTGIEKPHYLSLYEPVSQVGGFLLQQIHSLPEEAILSAEALRECQNYSPQDSKGTICTITLSSISSSFSLVFMVVYSFSNFLIFLWFSLRPYAMLNTGSGSESNLLGISFWKYCTRGKRGVNLRLQC